MYSTGIYIYDYVFNWYIRLCILLVYIYTTMSFTGIYIYDYGMTLNSYVVMYVSVCVL